MLTQEQLHVLLADLESDRVERTTSTTKTDKFGEAMCAFANDLSGHGEPGYLMIGANDDGTLSGLTVTDALLKNLAAIRSDGNLLPQPAINVARFVLQGGDLAVVEVLPSDLPPVRYKGRVWVRVGPRRGIANEHDERILSERRVARARSFDARPCHEAGIDDIALGQFDAYRREAIDPETIAANQRSVEQQLASLRLYDPEFSCPTHAGILLFGKNPRFFLPGAYVQYLKLPANDLTDAPVDQAEISGDLVSVLKELESRVRLIIQTSMKTSSGFEERLVPDYPEWALRELLMNAVMHRNYDSNTPIRFYVFAEHVEIQSPGGVVRRSDAGKLPNAQQLSQPHYRGSDEVLRLCQPLRLRRATCAGAVAKKWQPPGRLRVR